LANVLLLVRILVGLTKLCVLWLLIITWLKPLLLKENNNQEKILIPVGTAMIIVAAVK